MNSVTKNVVDSIFASVNLVKTQFVPVRYRYYADKIAMGPYSKKWGYTDNLFKCGVLGRLRNSKKPVTPVYLPKNAWSPERATFGRNDYIDILGGGKIKPADVAYDVPKWLRGRKGNEYQLLLLKKKVFSRTLFEYEKPTMWSSMSRRVGYLYRYLNRKTKTGFSEKQ